MFADKLGLSEYAIVTVVLNLYLLTKISKLAHWAILVPKFKLLCTRTLEVITAVVLQAH